MSFYHRIKRWFGYDTTTTVQHTMPVYDYTVVHINGEESRVTAHGYNVDGAFARFYTYEDVSHHMCISSLAIPDNQMELRVLENIREIERKMVGKTTFEVEYDVADREVTDKDVRTVYIP